MKRIFITLIVLAPVLGAIAEANWPARLEQQRQAFRDVWPAVTAGDRQPLQRNETLLADYPLYPDLQAAWLRTQVGKVADDEINRFLSTSDPGSLANSLRYRWTRSLARRAQWQDYLAQYQANYSETTDQQFLCYALQARLRTGGDAGLADDALAFWLHGRSRPDECDPVFDWLEQQGKITAEQRRQRIELALAQRQFSLAAWLARPLDASEQEQVQRWRRMRHRPQQLLEQSQQFADTERDRELVLYGVSRVARRDADAAEQYWRRYSSRLSFSDEESRRVQRELAYAAAQDYEEDAIERILAVDRRAIDDKLLAWGVRSALRQQAWDDVVRVIDLMSSDGRNKDQWQYWRARALEAQGAATDARIIYGKLAQRRGFYNFLAADRIEADYAYNHVPAVADDAVLSRLENQQGVVRAREMFFVDLNGRGRSEWDRHVKTLPRPEQAQSAILANRWGWHSVAIATASRAGLRDDLA
ncbi:MAG: hypothetical protein KJO55_02510, partial [Gammaproteobacteria bacterium]|nr:hypothetical protein [Gammaproteobacteria bacterium]